MSSINSSNIIEQGIFSEFEFKNFPEGGIQDSNLLNTNNTGAFPGASGLIDTSIFVSLLRLIVTSWPKVFVGSLMWLKLCHLRPW